jgi:hypothetical protein
MVWAGMLVVVCGLAAGLVSKPVLRRAHAVPAFE